MKKSLIKGGAIAASFALLGASANAQILDQKTVTITMDMQPILQLDMETPDQIEFVFDDIYDYLGGIIKFSGTILKVSSTVAFDLAAFGTSSGSSILWDQNMSYGAGNGVTPFATDSLCLCALELHQSPANPDPALGGAVGVYDYSTAFTQRNQSGAAASAVSTNSIYVNAANGTAIPASEDDSRYIVGGRNLVGANGAGGFFAQAAGSYLTATGNTSNYYYTIDYRLWPSLPPTFPNSHMLMDYNMTGATSADVDSPSQVATNHTNFITTAAVGATGQNYLEPGVYVMAVEYLLMEDQ